MQEARDEDDTPTTVRTPAGSRHCHSINMMIIVRRRRRRPATAPYGDDGEDEVAQQQ
jgi:hypothetical protein